MKNIVIYVHGKGGSAAEAEHYRQLFPDSEVIGFDYHAQTPWEAKEEFPEFFAQQRKHCDRLTLVANSIGAFFSLSSLDGALVDSACLISPVVDMEKLKKYDAVGRRDRTGACRKVGDSNGFRGNAVVEVPVLCAGASDFMARSQPHFVRRA